MKGTGSIVANDMKRDRQKATVRARAIRDSHLKNRPRFGLHAPAPQVANLHRLGVRNAIVSCIDGRTIPKVMRGFDRVLLDAPCSG